MIFFLSIMQSCDNYSWNDRDLKISQNRGDIIILALEKYHSDNLKYPNLLSDLIPNYIKKITQPIVGSKEWIYKKETIGFYLGVENLSGIGPVSFRTHEDNEWFTDTF